MHFHSANSLGESATMRQMAERQIHYSRKQHQLSNPQEAQTSYKLDRVRMAGNAAVNMEQFVVLRFVLLIALKLEQGRSNISGLTKPWD